MEGLKISPEDRYLINNNSIYKDKRTGYFQIYIDGEIKWLHRVILNAKKGQIVDHINCDRGDCRRGNLRFVTKAQNNYNSKTRKKSKYGRGITFDKYGNRFRACISYKNKTLKLGSFKNVEDAKIAYNKKAKEIYGDMAFQHTIANKNERKI